MTYITTWTRQVPRAFCLAFLCNSSSAFSSQAFTGKSTFVSSQRTKVPSTTTRKHSDLVPPLSMSLTLYGHPGTRSPLVNWACHELSVDFKMGDLSRNPHPFGQIPCMTDADDVLLFESGAILQYLNNNYSPSTLSKKHLAEITSWITWANASLDPICFLETPDGKVYDTGLKKANKRIDRLNEILSKQEWLVEGAGFTIADVAVASYLLYVLQFFPDVKLGERYPSMVKFMVKAASRENYAKAFGKDTQGTLLGRLSNQGTPDKKLFGVF
jgi:glutathione S-transferase